MEDKMGKKQEIKKRSRKVYERDYDIKDLEFVLNNSGKKLLSEIAEKRGLALSQVNSIVQGLKRQGFDIEQKPTRKTIFKVFAEKRVRRANGN